MGWTYWTRCFMSPFILISSPLTPLASLFSSHQATLIHIYLNLSQVNICRSMPRFSDLNDYFFKTAFHWLLSVLGCFPAALRHTPPTQGAAEFSATLCCDDGGKFLSQAVMLVRLRRTLCWKPASIPAFRRETWTHGWNRKPFLRVWKWYNLVIRWSCSFFSVPRLDIIWFEYFVLWFLTHFACLIISQIKLFSYRLTPVSIISFIV